MKRLILFWTGTLSIAVLSCFSLQAQIESLYPIRLPDGERDLRRIAENLMQQRNFKRAIPYFQKLDSLKQGEDPMMKFRIAQCYLRSSVNKRAAVQYLEAIPKEDISQFDEDYYYNLGKAYHLDYRFNDAIEIYNKFLEEASGRDKRRKEVNRAIDQCVNAQRLIKDTVEVTIRNLGKTVNSPYIDYAPVISADESVLIFTSRRKGSTGGLQNMQGEPDSLYGTYFEDIYASINIGGTWRKPVGIGSKINSRVHESCIGLSPDGQKLFIYRSDSVRWGNIFVSNRGVDWGRPRKLPSPINSDYWEGSASVTSDEQVIYFASNRPGGLGGKDIYRSRKLPNGNWGKPQRLDSTINTRFHDSAPFIHPDGKTLYFSSRGHNSMGGFDIFRTKRKEKGGWTPPSNIGYPINTPDEDIYFVLSADGERGYYASAKPGGYGSLDLYEVKMPTKVEALTLVRGHVTGGCTDKNIQAQLELRNQGTGKVEGKSQSNQSTGKYLFILDKGKRYVLNASAPKHHPFSDTIVTKANEKYKEINLEINLTCKRSQKEETQEQPSQAKKKSRKTHEKTPPEKEPLQKIPPSFKMIHFGFDQSTLTTKARDTLDQLAQFLNENPGFRISIIGYTDAKGSSKYNKQLSKRRAQRAKEYLMQKGIPGGRLKATAKAADNPVAPNTSEQGRAQNRRVEFKIIQSE